MNREWPLDLGLLVLRLTGLGLAVAHGWGKVMALSSEGAEARFVGGVDALGFPLPYLFAWAAALAEFAGGLLIALGLFTRVAAAAAAVAMFVASFMRHRFGHQVLVWTGILDVPEETVAGWGNAELAAVYLAIFVALTLIGGGRFSLDRVVRRSRRRGR
jgi:putative oxidoreductase